MELRFSPHGPFAEETTEILEELDADAVMLFVFGSSKGSGCCCQIEVADPEHGARQIIDAMKGMIATMEESLKRGHFKSPDEDDRHEQALN